MPYGTIKVDNVIYTKGGVDTTITVSGIVDSLSGAISVTGSISGASVSATTGTFTTLSGNTTAGTTATFVTGVFTTSLSGATITGNTGQFSNITGVSGVFTTRISGATITGNTGQFSSITGISGVFTSVSGTTFTVTSGVFASGTAAAPSVSVGTTTNGLYSSATNEVALATASTSRLVVDASGNVNIDSGTFYVDAVNNRVGIGTTGPSYAFDVANTVIQVGTGTDAFVQYKSTAGNWHVGVTSGGAYNFYTGTYGTGAFRMSLDASGNLGLGVVPSAWGASFKVLDFAGASFASNTAGTAAFIAQNAYYDSAWKYKSSTNATLFQTDSGSFQWYTSTNTPSVNGAITFTQVMTLDASGRLGVGTTNIRQALTFGNLTSTSTATPDSIDLGATYTSTTASTNLKLKLYTDSSGNTYGFTVNGSSQLEYYAGIVSSPGSHVFLTGGSERARIDSSGRLLVGTSSARTNFFNGAFGAALQVEGTTNTTKTLSVFGNTGDQFSGGIVVLGASRGTSAGSNTIVQSGDELGVLSFQGSDGTEPVDAAQITAFVDGTPGANDMPGRLVFSTTADGAASPTERMRIGNDGWVYIGTTSKILYAATTSTTGLTYAPSAGELGVASSGANAFYVNRTVNDGNLVSFFQDGINEGTISVSGTTVSYNGAHLSRWSQLPSDVERTEILRGTVLSNIDEMCEWGEEDNEQLNRMKVSDVEGDKNVAGVFQGWDDDDDTYTNDFYCAMTGDFIIRIGAGVTVERGDLLMSAGDGTAKPQDDDIIRSKTIAKVTSTNVTCTYNDGSYCVPCVLMAC